MNKLTISLTNDLISIINELGIEKKLNDELKKIKAKEKNNSINQNIIYDEIPF